MAVDELVREFLVESHEGLDRLDREFVTLEGDPEDRGCLSSIFRTIHTIKGTSGFFGYAQLERVAHAGETLLASLRDGELKLTPAITSGLLSMVDVIRRILARIEVDGQEAGENFDDLVERLKTLHAGESTPTRSLGDILIEKGKASPEQIEDAVEQQAAGDPLRLGEILVEKTF
jgi:two-component system chemotaxis sensor kinase CheA